MILRRSATSLSWRRRTISSSSSRRTTSSEAKRRAISSGARRRTIASSSRRRTDASPASCTSPLWSDGRSSPRDRSRGCRRCRGHPPTESSNSSSPSILTIDLDDRKMWSLFGTTLLLPASTTAPALPLRRLRGASALAQRLPLQGAHPHRLVLEGVLHPFLVQRHMRFLVVGTCWYSAGMAPTRNPPSLRHGEDYPSCRNDGGCIDSLMAIPQF